MVWEAHRRGIRPVITGRSVHESVSKFPPDSQWHMLDLTNHISIEEFFEFNDCFDYVFWVAGVLIEKPLIDLTLEELYNMTSLHYVGPIEFLGNLMRCQIEDQRPLHLVTISSTSNSSYVLSVQSAKFQTDILHPLSAPLPFRPAKQILKCGTAPGFLAALPQTRQTG